MASPKFSVGEIVIVESKSYPEVSGEYTILSICLGYELDSIYRTTLGGVWCYELDGLSLNLRTVISNKPSGVICKHMAEQSLRKKHKPSEFGSFTELMKSLKLPQKVK